MKLIYLLLISLIITLLLCPSSRVYGQENVPKYRLGLKESESMALNYSYAIKAAKMGEREASGKIMSAWSNALPSVSGSFSKTLTDTYTEKRAGSNRDKWNNLYRGSVTATQPIYSGGKALAEIRGAKYYRRSVDEQVRLERHNILYLVRQNYYKILLDKEMVSVAREQVKLADKYLEDVKKRRQIEIATDYAVLRAEVEKTNETTALTDAENELDKSQNAFLQLLGLPLNSELELTEKLEYEEIPTPKEQDLYYKAISYRPELRQSDLAIKMKKESISSTRAELLPHLSATGTYSGTATDADESPNEYKKDWEAGLTLSFKIFDGLLYWGKIKELKAQKEKLEYEKLDLSDKIKLEVKYALLDINSAATSVKSQMRNVEQANESLRLTVARDRQGVSTHLDVLTARQTLAVAQRNYYRSIYFYKNAWNKLALAVGVIEKGNPEKDMTLSGKK